MENVAALIAEFGFPIVMMVSLGYFVYWIWNAIQTVINPAVSSQHMALIKLIDQVRMLDNDIIRLQEKVDTVLQIKENEILIKVEASSLNYQDLIVAIGSIPNEDKRFFLGDASGEVIEIGENVSKWRVGDKIMSVCFPKWIEGRPKREYLSFIGDNEDGFATEYISLPETAVTKIPQGWSQTEVATLPCAGLTAWRALVEEGNLQAGETVLIQGTGGVSIFALQLAKSMGAKVVATSSSHEKLEKLKALGADELINYKETPKWGKEVKIKTDNEGVDHVIEVGGGGTFSQ